MSYPQELRKLDKARRVARYRGKPYMVTHAEAEQAFALIRHCRRMGMPNRTIADQVGISESNISQMANGVRYQNRGGEPVRQMWRTTWEKVMTLKFEAPTKAGARIDATGARRRMQALSCLGFSHAFMAEWLDIQKPCVWRICAPDRAKWVYFNTHRDVIHMYDKLYESSPADHGVKAGYMHRAQAEAKAKGYAPPGCWDMDLLDDPDAIPEWTGECGTHYGASLHRKYGIPMCDPCRLAKLARREELGYPKRRRRGK